MGQYASYISIAYAAAAVILVINVLLPWRRSKTVRRRLHEFYRMRNIRE